MPRLSLCMIVRDEERLLPGCLESVRGVADEIVVVDTGSADATREVARRMGARVHEFPWQDDFAAARNEALSHATGAFVLQLDADERLAPGAGATLRRATRQHHVDLWTMRLHNAARDDAPVDDVLRGGARLGNPVRVPRLMRRVPGLRYRGAIHESVEEWVASRGNRFAEADADIVHLGAVPGARAGKGKGERNRMLLRRQCEVEPDSVTAFGHLALEHLEAGEFVEAARVAERAWGLLDLQPAHRSIHLVAVARALAALQRNDAATALETVARAERLRGPRADLHFARGRALELLAVAAPLGSDRDRFLAGAIEAYGRAVGDAEPPFSVQVIWGASSFAGRCRMGVLLLLASRPAEALEAFESVLRSDVASRPALLGRAEALLDLGRPERALEVLEPLLQGPGPDGWLLAAAAARALGATEDARVFLQRAKDRMATGLEGAHRARRLEAETLALGPADRR